MVVPGLRDVVNDNLPFRALRVRMAMVILLRGKARERQAAQTRTRSAAAVCEARRARALARALFLTKSVIFVQIQRAFILLTPARFHQQKS
jgi:hypothetical protein